MNLPHETPPPRRRLTWRRMLLGLLVMNVALFAVCGLGAWWWIAQSARAVDQELVRIRAAGEPATAEDLNALPGPPQESDVTEMLIPILEQLDSPDFQQDARLVPVVGTENQQTIPPVGQPWDELEAAETLLAKYESEMRDLHEANDWGCRVKFPKDFRDGIEIELLHEPRMRIAAQMLALEGYVRAHHGDAAGAAESIARIFVLSSSLENGYLLMIQTYRISIALTGIRLLAETLPHVEYSEDHLTRLRRALRLGDDRAELTKGLMGERGVLAQLFRDPEAMGLDGGDALGAILPRGPDTAYFLMHMRAGVNASKLPFPQAIHEIRGLDVRAASHARSKIWQVRHYFTHQLRFDLEPAFAVTARAIAGREMADAAIAVELYRRKHGKLPESLAQLKPGFLSEVPSDPYDGQPIRYHRTDEGFVIYSVGRDGVDDGGKGNLDDNPDLVLKYEKN